MTIRVIVLAAGFGSRLQPYTENCPKGLVEFAGIPMLERQLAVLTKAGIEDIVIVGGFRSEQIKALGYPFVVNEEYDKTNMVSSLLCARDYLDGKHDVLISYSDIIYEPSVLESIVETGGDFVVAADKGWYDLWQTRMENPLEDAETFKVNDAGQIYELGKKAKELSEVQGQYIGLMKLPASKQDDFLAAYDSLDRAAIFDGKSFDQMYLTTMIQKLIDENWRVAPAWIENGWLEVDTVDDLKSYYKLKRSGGLDKLIDLDQLGGIGGAEKFLEEMVSFVEAKASEIDDFTPNSVVAPIFSLIGTLPPNTIEFEAIEWVRRKIEVAGVLYRQYEQGSFRPVKEAGKASSIEIEVVLVGFLICFAYRKDLRDINTVLKALNGVLSIPETGTIDARLQEWAENLLSNFAD